MPADPAIEEIRAVRRAISKRFDHDTKALLDHYRELESRYEGRMLSQRVVSLHIPKGSDDAK